VVARADTAISDEDTAETLGARLAVLGAELLGATLPSIIDGRATFEPQDDARATLAPILRKEDGRLSFAAPARAVSARARGVDPWPGATAVLVGATEAGTEGGESLGALRPEPLIVKLFRPRVVATASPPAAPGTIIAIDDEAGAVVACGDGAVAFAELQLPGRKRLPARAAAAGRAISIGMRLE